MSTHPGHLTSGFIKHALQGKAKLVASSFDSAKRIRRVSTDSRSIQPGDLFIAIKGEAFDGHDFIAKAVEKGAAAVLCEKYPAAAPQAGVDIFLVEDTLDGFRTLAQHWREFIDPVVIAVAGSVGKTTTKDILAALLSGKFKKLVWTKGSQNGFLGLPITLMELAEDTEAAVVEVGIDAPMAMQKHINLVMPEVAIVTAISEEHLEWLENLETVAREENLILNETAAAGGTAIVNLDDPWIKPLMQSLKASGKIGFTLGGSPAPDIVSGKLNGAHLEINGFNRLQFSLHCPLPGEHNARNLLGAAAVALVLGVTPDEMEEGLSSFAPSGGRSQMETLKSGTRVFCDFYNANPASMRAAFKVVLDCSTANSTKWLCLGDMKELGISEEGLHRQLAADIRGMGANTKVLLFGEKMKWLADELRKRDPQIPVSHAETHDLLALELKQGFKKDDVVLLKGSRSMHMEKVWELIKA
jgi:UDP-N-acetylmuramoyl-tripeptide--D-alanyl-D-alanine ligase